MHEHYFGPGHIKSLFVGSMDTLRTKDHPNNKLEENKKVYTGNCEREIGKMNLPNYVFASGEFFLT
ncbi:hypothetical protein GCM10020331_009460 [Ectobacillus funiculus]